MLPSQAGDKLKLETDAVVTLVGENVPEGARIRWSVDGLGGLVSRTDEIASGTVTVRLEDYTNVVRGLFALKGELLVGRRTLCALKLRVQVGEGFSGPVATGSAAASAVTGLGAAASVPLTANGLVIKLNASAAIHRRRPTGIRRWLPVPAWRRTIIGLFIGVLTSICISIVLQQASIYPLSLAMLIKNAIIGGGVTVGIGYSIGAIFTYIRPPQAE